MAAAVYRAAAERYGALRERIKGYDVGLIRDFCLGYRNAELEYRRSNALFSLGYTKEEYERYLAGEKMPKEMQKALGRVKKIRSAELSAATLLSCDSRCECELKSPERRRIITTLTRLVPSTLCMLVTVSVMVSAKDNMTAAGVIEAILKLSTLPVIGLKGYSGGYEYVTESETAWLETRSRLIEAFLKGEEAKV